MKAKQWNKFVCILTLHLSADVWIQPQYARHRYQEEDSHSHSKELHSQRQLFENKIDAHHTYADNEELDSQLWTENVDPRVDLSPLKAREFSHRDRAFSITRDLYEVKVL
ncbi:hypothetical protein CCR75_003846 [Bremia lactucae]|uniref:RxLR effector protein n=1 Tax=Bremia lactucae TaxID=4779 RepID=A0A976IL92_BRELC|nr:hypothetical protein CCR75_003846 [Bremia lactucae]